MSPKVKIISLSLFLLLAIIFGYAYYQNNFSDGGSEGTPIATNKSLREDNSDFSAGVDASNRGNLEESKRLFSSALSKEQDSRAQAIIKLSEATAYLRLATSTADKVMGVSKMDDLIEATSTPSDIKAYAVQNLGQWYLAVRDQELYGAIFNHPRFSSYQSATNKEESINNLFLYSLEFYKLSIPLLKTTLWDVDRLVASSKVASSAKDSLLEKIPAVLTEVDKDTAVVLEAGNPIDTMSIFLARARLLVGLDKLTGSTMYGDPVLYFNRAYERAELNHVGVTKGYILLHLSSYYLEKNDKENLRRTLDSFVSDSSISSSPFTVFLRKLPTDKDSPSDMKLASDLRKMAEVHPGLKKQLTDLGWVF